MNYEDIEIETKTLFRNKIIARRDKEFILDLSLTSETHPDYVSAFYRNPKLFMKIINEVKNEELNANNFVIRVEGISSIESISGIRTQHIGNLIKIRGIISNMTKNLALTVKKIYECPKCGTIRSLNVEEGPAETPTKCSCGAKGLFRLISDVVIDMQELELEEIHDEINNRQPEKIRIRLLNNLTNPEFKGKLQPGNKAEVIGVIEKVKTKRVQTEDEIYEYRVLAVDIVNLDEDYNDKLTEEDELTIREIAGDNPLEKLSSSLAPEIYGHEFIKKSIVLSMFGGVQKKLKDGKFNKHNIHLFLVGDAGQAKTVLLKSVQKRMPKSYYVSGEGMTAAGITASVEKDELLGTWGLKAGALVKANGSVCIVDELDKANSYAKQALHTPLESGEVPISKAGINTSLKANCAVIAAANPKDGRFDPSKPLVAQINMVPTLLSRFDVIHVMRDIVDENVDSNIVDTLFDLEGKESLISVDLFRKYVLYARKLKPKLNPKLNEEIKKFYNKVRKQSISSSSNMEGMPITPRHLLGLLRMAEAHAKIRLSDTVELEDLEMAKKLYYDALIKLGLDDTGSLDIARISYGKTGTKRRGMELVINLLKKAKQEEGIIKKEELKEMVKNDINSFDFEEILSQLSKEGFIVFTRVGIELIV